MANTVTSMIEAPDAKTRAYNRNSIVMLHCSLAAFHNVLEEKLFSETFGQVSLSVSFYLW